MTAAALFYLSGAMETEAEPAAGDQNSTEQAPSAPAQNPSTQQTPSGAAPAQTEQKSDTLPTVSVQASRPRAPAAVRAAPSRPVAALPPPAQPVATDQAGTGGTNPPLGPTPYQVTNTGITRLPVPILNMPQTVNVIPQAIIQEQNATTIEQALQYIPGITFSAGEGGQQGDGPIIRGFVARGDLFRDGIRDPGWYTRDAFSIDRIEVYKGPSAFAFGRGATGGAINYVTRLPTGANYLESTSTVMTGNGYREPTEKSTIYAAYGNSYNPSAELGTLVSASNAALAPEQTRTMEIGAKADVRNGLISLAGAVFRIEKTNLRINDPFNNTVMVLDGVARVDGVEVGATGKVTDRWSVFTGYSYLESTILDTRDKSILNKHLQNTPRNNYTMWTTYEVTSQWTVGGGAIYQSMGWANNTNTGYVPEFWKFDAMISYKVDEKSTVQLNVYNLTDKLYYSQYFGGNVVPASGRWASLTYRARW